MAKKKTPASGNQGTPDYSDLDPDLAELLEEVDNDLQSDDTEPERPKNSSAEQSKNESDVADDTPTQTEVGQETHVEADGHEEDVDGENSAKSEANNGPLAVKTESPEGTVVMQDSPDTADNGKSEDGIETAEEDNESSDVATKASVEESHEESEPDLRQNETDADSEQQQAGLAEQVLAEPPPKKLGWWQRLVQWLRGPDKAETPAKPLPTAPESPKPQNLEKELAQKKRALEKSRKVADRERIESEKLQQRLDAESGELERVNSWVEGLERSYFWNVRKRMQANLAQANRELETHRQAVNNVSLPEKDELLALRQRFHKRLGIGFLVAAIPVALLFFIPWFAEASMPTWLVEFLNSQFFAMMLAGVLALTAGIVGIIRRIRGPKKMSWGRMVASVFLVALVPLLVFATYQAQQWLQTYVVPLIERWLGPALVFIAISFLFFLVGILATYYSGWSGFNREVTEQLTRLDNVIDGYVHSQREVQRLDSLYGQTADWLQLLAHSLYRPWKTDPDWEGIRELQTTSETFPFSLRVAHAIDSETSRIANLERLIGQRLMTQGWRNEAFNDTLSEISQQLGFDEKHVTADLLDADLPHQTNNSRNLVKAFFEHSAGVRPPTTPPGDKDSRAQFTDEYLISVARRRLRELIEKTQSSVLSEARPEVEQIVVDPLQPIKFDASSLDMDRTAQDWDDFLRDAIGMSDVSDAPLSTLTFTDEGSLARDPESAETHILIPERIAASAPDTSATSSHIHALPDQGTGRSVELIVRMDVVGPVPFSHVRMVESATQGPVHSTPMVDDDDSDL